MSSNKTTFTVLDCSDIANGYKIAKEGVDLSRFLKNPIMYYMHDDEKGIIGRWENIHLEGEKFIADAIFDESTQLGREVKERVDNGFLRGASVGIRDIQLGDNKNDVQTVVKCCLFEVSIVDIPASQNAVKMTKNDKKQQLFFSIQLEENNNSLSYEDFVIKLTEILGLSTDSDLESILTKIQELQDGTDDEIVTALNQGLIDETTAESMQFCKAYDLQGVRKQLNNARTKQRSITLKLIEKANGEGKFIWQERGVFERIAEKMGIKTLRELLSILPEPIKPMNLIRGSKTYDGDESKWGLAQYRKYSPEILKDDPELYDRLLLKEGAKRSSCHSLEWYRKNDPEYLQANPQIYKELVKRELNK